MTRENWTNYATWYESQVVDELASDDAIDYVECSCPPRGIEVETWPYYEGATSPRLALAA